MGNFKLGLVGCGAMMGTHVKGVTKLHDVEISALCDIIPEKAQAVADELGIKVPIYTNFRKMVDDVDGVLVAIPHDLHFECGMFFALNKKHVLMEKPLCNTEEECLRLINTCDEMGVTLMCAYPVPFWPGIVKLKELVDSGDFGKIIQMSVWTEQLTGAKATYVGEESPWSYTNRLGGGQLFSHGCHYVDLLLRFLGRPVSGAHLGTNVGTPWMLLEGTSSVVFKFENGAVAYHGATWGARGSRLRYDFQIHTEKGLLDYLHHAGEIRLYSSMMDHVPGEVGGNNEYKVLWKRDGEASKETQFEIQHFVDCVRNGKEPMTSGKKALQSLRVIWKIYDAEKHNVVADLRGLGLEDSMK